MVIPAYNEAARIERSLHAVRRYLDREFDSWEILVVDDGSTDDTAAVALHAAAGDPRIRLIRSGRNRGKGYAVRSGVLASTGALVLFTDADLATPIDEIGSLLTEISRGALAAIGSRANPHSGAPVSPRWVRGLLGRLGNRTIQALLLPGIADTQCGFKLFDGDSARAAFARSIVDGWGFDVEVLVLFRRFGWPIGEVQVRWEHRPGSTVGPRAYLEVLADTMRLRRLHGRTRSTGGGVPVGADRVAVR